MMSFLIDTDLLSMLERRRVPAKLVKQNEAEIFLSVVSFAEIQFGLDQAPATHQASLAAWLAETRRKFAPATEYLTEPCAGNNLSAHNDTSSRKDRSQGRHANFHFVRGFFR